MDAQEVVEPVVQVAFGDEMRAYDTIKDFINGRPVSAGDALETAFTIGSDLAMLIPGVGAGVAAAKAGSRAAKAAKAASTLSKSVEKGRRATAAAIKRSEKPNVVNKAKESIAKRSSKRADAKFAKAKAAIKKDKRMAVRRETESRSAVDAYQADAQRWSKKANQFKAKRNSKIRKKTRRYGAAGSMIGNIQSAADYLREVEE